MSVAASRFDLDFGVNLLAESVDFPDLTLVALRVKGAMMIVHLVGRDTVVGQGNPQSLESLEGEHTGRTSDISRKISVLPLSIEECC